LTRQSLPSVNFNDNAARDDAAGDDNTVLYLQFLPARRYASAGLCDSDVSVHPSVVCLDVRHTPVLWLAERKQGHEMYTL